MAGIFIKTGVEVLKLTGRTSRFIGGLADDTRPVIIRPVKDFGRGLIRGSPKHIPIGGASEGTTTTITASLRAGMQTRHIAGLAAHTAVKAAPAAGVRVAKYIAQASVRDTIITPVYVPALSLYRSLTIYTRTRGYVGAVERVLEPKVLALNRRLHVAGLAPTLPSTIVSLARGGLGVSLYIGIDQIGEKIDEIHATSRKYLSEAEKALDDKGIHRPAGSSPSYIPVEPSGGAPAVPAPVVLPPAFPAAPVPAPVNRSRRYIPVER